MFFMFSFMQHATFYFVLVLLSFMVNKWPFYVQGGVTRQTNIKEVKSRSLLNFKARNDCDRIMKSKIILECAKHSNCSEWPLTRRSGTNNVCPWGKRTRPLSSWDLPCRHQFEKKTFRHRGGYSATTTRKST